ncbi:MFS general substrate transporter [Hortaea werneckii]|nr:MFS general substrate transporter [Hortaea werneckii]KAI7092672.1 MFS general substrate transporter [Hortaea werneckii]KAI7231216.1 MFS general substrate transporter [Hortaea werneckii]KAI7310642.1 MFS general substrate transporter [Hortaea werneckii]KAI7399641.1 MFS general substrate transporter [Hortaea werneckii]
MNDKIEVTRVEEHMADNEAPGATIELLRDGNVVLRPPPTADPNDPLNLPQWRKWMILLLVSAYSCTAVVLASGLGPIYSMIKVSYPEAGNKTNDLLTYPTLLMGIGNLISMPLAMVVGRRLVFLLSMVVLVLGGLWCALSTSLISHIAGRNIMSLAAGQSEALAPMMIQEVFFLHEKGRKLGWFIFIQNATSGAFFIMSTYLVGAYGWKWWYALFTIINAVLLLVSYVFVTETSYPNRADMQHAPRMQTPEDSLDDTKDGNAGAAAPTVASRPILDAQTYGPRTWKGDLRLLCRVRNWYILPNFYLQVVQGLCVPSILWLLLLNGAFLGIYVFMASTFSGILLAPPYRLSFEALGYVQAGQIVVCLIFLPLLGYGSDWVIKFMSRHNNGAFKPEYRLLLLWIPAIVGVVCTIIYGQVGKSPEKWSVAAPIFTYNASFFAFVGANVVGITYAVDSFPARAEAFLVVICAGRGIISFGLSYATLPSIEAIGYSGALNIQGGIAGGLASLAIVFYVFGPRLRVYTNSVLGIGN